MLLIDEFSYASEAHSLPRQLAIRAIELCSGQPYLKRLYRAYQAENLPHTQFWQEVIRRLDLTVELSGADMADMPQTGPLVVVANHPYGVLDGIVICWLVSQIRPDFKILINNVLCRAPEMANHVLPVDFDETPQALQTNLASRKQAKEHGTQALLRRMLVSLAGVPESAIRSSAGTGLVVNINGSGKAVGTGERRNK